MGEKKCPCLNLIHPALHVSDIKKLIPLLLHYEKEVQYSRWSTLFRVTARAYNVLHHIDSTIPTPSDIDTTLWAQLDAVVLSWIYSTISTDLLDAILDDKSTAMDAWTRLRDLFQQQHEKKRKKNVESDKVDSISSLPDDVLVYLLSFVGVKAAERSSLLSKRWRHVWTHLIDLDFDDPQRLAIVMTLPNNIHKNPEIGNFVKWVNQVITANRAPYLNTFRICFPINDFYAPDIDNWLEFAFARKVRNLHLNLACASPRIQYFNNPALAVNITLESLYLKSVSVNGPLLQWVLSNCLNLQRLSLHMCTTRSDASSKHKELVISSLKLKHLEFHSSSTILNTEALHIFAPNLTSFFFFENHIYVQYRSVPSLVDAAFGGLYSRRILHNMDIISGFSCQLEKLSLEWYKVASSGFPTFENVKQLELFYRDQGDDLLPLTSSLIEACPLLHTFKLKLASWSQQERLGSAPKEDAGINAVRAHRHLEAIEFVGFAGSASAAELALCLTRHAPMLNKFIFDPRAPYYINGAYRDEMAIARSKAELLAKRIRGGVDLVIL